MKALGQQAPGRAVFQAVEQVAQDAKARWHHAAGVAGMHAFGQHLHLQHPAGHAAQAVGEPQLVVVASARVQAHHQAHVPQAGAQCIDVRQEVVRTAFFAGFDQTDDARMPHILGLKGLNRGNGGVSGVTVIGTAAAIELAVLVLGCPGPQVAAPARKLGLLVQVAVHQHGLRAHGVTGAASGGHFKQEDWCAARQSHDLERQARHSLRLDPLRRVAHHGFKVAMDRPVRVKCRGFGRDGDVIAEARDDVAVPRLAHLMQNLGGVESGVGQAGGHGRSP